MNQLILTALAGLPLLAPGDDLTGIILQAMETANLHMQDGDILAIAQKAFSKVENRFVTLSAVIPSPLANEWAQKTGKDPRVVELILAESVEVVRWRLGVMVVAHRLGFVSANAGIDASNVGDAPDEQVLLLPANPDASCAAMQTEILRRTGATVGIIMNDSHGRAWRNGTVGVAIGVAGVPALLDKRGTPDLFGRLLQITQVGMADELAAAASFLMGQANEGLPVIHIRGVDFAPRHSSVQELIRPKEQDMFR
ncbi:MAG TPA: coenzyme F420-0:L-glutamate ligase [Anaerolineales bacterium]|nr:coenzyme F420-0:L-glutamate ligase [Anaerolineales bacterium]